MTSAVCTLFEGDFHYGLGALANSLYAGGFRGTIYAGYRGQLPPWARNAQPNNGSHQFSPANGLDIRFIPVNTSVHLTNYKPDFMLHLWEKYCPSVDLLFYFDPDIVVRFPWTFFQEWSSDSVALCEDVNSPMPASHPKRNAWRRLLNTRGHKMENKVGIYVNGGFVALSRAHREFLMLWSKIITQIGEAGVRLDALKTVEDYRFWNNDQDALNIAVMETSCPTSCAGKEGMGFITSNSFMLHAVGYNKPWKTSLLRQFINGKRPSDVQRAFWDYVAAPIRVFPPLKIKQKRLGIKLAAFGSRFYGS